MLKPILFAQSKNAGYTLYVFHNQQVHSSVAQLLTLDLNIDKHVSSL